MADTPQDKSEKTELSEEEIKKLRSSLHKAIDSVDPRLLNILGGTTNSDARAAVDVTVCDSKCL